MKRNFVSHIRYSLKIIVLVNSFLYNIIMSYTTFIGKIRQWDNKAAKWMTRHFYILFFEIFLVFIFIGLFVIILKTIDISVEISQKSIIERLLMMQNLSTILILLLLLLNSFWMLYIFNGILRIRSLLKELNFNLTKKLSK